MCAPIWPCSVITIITEYEYSYGITCPVLRFRVSSKKEALAALRYRILYSYRLASQVFQV